MIRDSEMGRLSWITRVGSEYNLKVPHKRETIESRWGEGGDLTMEADIETMETEAKLCQQHLEAGSGK